MIFTDNPLSILEYCYTCAKSEQIITNDITEKAIKEKNQILIASKKDIRDIIKKALLLEKPSYFFNNLNKVGLLEIIMPDLYKSIDCKQNRYHNSETVFEHLLRSLDAAAKLKNNIYFRLAALCHDIAKPHTKNINNQGEITFHKHEVVGATIVYEWMSKYYFPYKEIEYVSKLIRYHQFYFYFSTENNAPKTTMATLRKWLQNVGKNTWYDLILLRMADRRGNIKKQNYPALTKELKILISKCEELIKNKKVIFFEDLAITKNDLKKLNINKDNYKDIIQNLLGLVKSFPERNNKNYLLNYIKRNFGVKNV